LSWGLNKEWDKSYLFTWLFGMQLKLSWLENTNTFKPTPMLAKPETEK